MATAAVFNIDLFIGKNAIITLTETYNYKLLEKIKNNFNEIEQQIFVSSFYCYLNYHPTQDFVIDLENVWVWLGFSQKSKAKLLLEKQFVIDKDYKYILTLQGEQKKEGRGGRNREIIMLNIDSFKLFCIKANTAKAKEIHTYFVKLERLLFETIQEECADFKNQLEVEKNNKINREIEYRKEQMTLREQTIVELFPENVQCVYYGKINNTNENGEQLVKFGSSNNLQDRITRHKKTFEGFYLINAFKVNNCKYVENSMKTNRELKKIRYSIKINDKLQTELYAINENSYEKLNNIIKDIIKEIEYNPENYVALLDKSVKLEKENQFLKKYKQPPVPVPLIENEEHDTEEENEVSAGLLSRVRINNKSKDGKYHIQGNIYDLLIGTREQVWNKTAYQTQGKLKKDDLMISTSRKNKGDIISKIKHNKNTHTQHIISA